MTHIVSEARSKEDFLAWLQSGEPVDLMQIVRMGWMLLRPPEFGDQVREAVLQQRDIPFEVMVRLLQMPWSIPLARLKEHPLYPLYLMEGKDAAAGAERYLLLENRGPSYRINNRLAEAVSAFSTRPQLLQIFGEIAEKQADATTDPVGSSTPDRGELAGVDHVGRNADDEAEGHHQNGHHQHPGHPGVRLDGVDDQE